MKLSLTLRSRIVLIILWIVLTPLVPAQLLSGEALKEKERQLEKLESEQAAAKAEAQRRKDAEQKAKAGAKRKADERQRAEAAEKKRNAAQKKAERERLAAEATRRAEQRKEDEQRRAEEIRAARGNATALAGEFVDIPGGMFRMGCSPGDSECQNDEKPAHTVSIKAFRMGKTEVTQAQWRAVMGGNPSHFSNCGGDCPVEQVSFDDVQDFIAQLNRQTGQHYRLPSEVEWEYACRAGRTQIYCGSGDVDAVAWVNNNSDNRTHPVGQKRQNDFGLYDMSGNVWEWTKDCWHDNYNGAPSDNVAWTTGGDCARRVLRGGSWNGGPEGARSSDRFWSVAGNRDDFVGSRLLQDE